ncbi:MAG: metal-dependent hydrolase [Rubrivivax sp.]|nr:MAG: metal-dependent hydrolase [Rubrivivax sp.]
MKQATASTTHDMTVRHLDVDLSQGFEPHWNGGDAYRSQVFNALSFMFPVGEQFFIDAVRHFLPEIERQGRTELVRDIKLFVGQEATHRHLHQQYNDHLVKLGYDAWVERMLQRVMHLTRNAPPKFKLAITAAYEHFTALLGDGLLRRASWSAQMEPTMRAVWQWHAAEESEHKAVAMDTYNAVGGGYLMRVGLFLFITLEFNVWVLVQTCKMLRRDGALFKLSTWRSALGFWLGREGVLWHTLPHWLAYFKPSFHPWQHDNQALLERWRQEQSHAYRTVATRP